MQFTAAGANGVTGRTARERAAGELPLRKENVIIRHRNTADDFAWARGNK